MKPHTDALLSIQQTPLHFAHRLLLASPEETVGEELVLLAHEEESIRKVHMEEVLDGGLSDVEKPLEGRPREQGLEGSSATRTPVRLSELAQASIGHGLPVIATERLGLPLQR